MKQIWPDYSYSPTTNVLTLTGLNIDRDQLLLVTAADRGRIIYNFADSSVTASAFTSGANTALTLVATTAGLTNTAALVIYYDDQLASTTVTVSSLPAISGTVTANAGSGFPAVIYSGILQYTDAEGSIPVSIDALPAGTAQIGSVTASISGTVPVSGTFWQATQPVSGTFFQATQPVSLASTTVTVSSLSALVAGTANIGVVTVGNIRRSGDGALSQLSTEAGSNYLQTVVMPGTSQIGSVTASISGTVPVSISSVTVGNSVTIGSFATSVTARLINPAGTAVTYAEVGTAGSPSIDVLSIQGVTSGSPVPISISSVTIGSLPAISGTVTANLSISSTAITSGSFTSLTSATLVPANTARKMATVYNLGAGQLFVNAGVTATTLGGGFMVALSSGDYFECPFTTTTLSAIFATAGTASWVSH
jgi:hypothetical protein